MAFTRSFLNSIRKSITSFPHIAPIPRHSHPNRLSNVSSFTVDCWSTLRGRLTPLESVNQRRWLIGLFTRRLRSFSSSAGKIFGLGLGSGTLVLGASFFVGSTEFSRRFACAMDDYLEAKRDFLDASDEKQELPPFWLFVRKLWLPAFFLLTMLLNWDQPLILASKVVLFLVTTKPSPLSVYVFVEKLCQELTNQRPYMYILKSLYASRVDVQDYKLLCLATVEVGGQKLVLVGVLGGWWVLPSSREALATSLSRSLY